MACSSCGNSRPVTPVVVNGMPTIWTWLKPSPDLVPVDTAEALVVIESMNGPVN